MERFDEAYRQLNSAQRQAVDSIDGPVLVVAGPGTGKTQLLSLRLANILRKTDTHPNNILCLTYTESGKEAMQNRLAEFIGKASKQVEVHTFHGFGRGLISRFEDYFPELIGFRPAEDLMLYETLLACLEQLPRDNPLSKKAYGQFVYQSDAQNRISQLKQAGISPTTAKLTAQQDIAWSRTTGSKLTASFNEAGRLSPKSLIMLTNSVAAFSGEEPASELGKICLRELQAAIDESTQSGKTTALSGFKKKWLTSEEGRLYFKPGDQLKKIKALADLYADYESELSKRKLYDYDDMLLFAIEKLRKNPQFLASLQETFQYILVDEYQDTNAAQASIINYIADSPVNEARPNVMVVGDDDQAIYGFQGALGDILMDFRERWREVKVIILKENYRSTRSILDLSRGVITRGRNRLENHYEDIDKTLHSNTKYTDIMPTQYETNSSQAAIEKAVIAAQSNDNRQLAIIASKHKYLRDLAKQLDKAKVSYYYEGREGLLEDPVIEDLLLLADLLLAISQNNLIRTSYVLPEIIAKGLVEIPRLEAWRIALDAKTHKYSWWEAIQVNQSQLGGRVQELKILAESLKDKEATASLKQIARHYKFRVLNKIQKLIDHSASYYGRSDLTLGEILRYVELCKQAGIALEQKIVKGKEHSKVILLSAHKSKGQEFDRVYVLHADYNTWFREAGKRNNLVLPENWKLIEPRSMDEDDRLRLLYVVMTRAKQELSLIKGNPNAQTVPGAEEIKTIQIVSEQIEAFSPPDEESWRSWYLPKNKAEQIQLKDFLAPILASYRLSPSHLTSYLDIAHGGPETFFSSVLLEIPEPIHPEALFGSYVHRTLRFAQESLNKTGKLPSAQQLSNYFATDFPTIDPRVMKDVLEVVRKYLQNEALPKGGVAEFTFSNKNVSFDGVALTGTVDNYVLKDNKLTITDFKTGRVLNSWQVREDYYAQKLHRFRQQLLFYELLFRLSSDFSSVEVIVSKISFVEATQRGTYHELTLDADKDERRRLELLIQAVQQKIKNLEFASIAQYSADLHGLKQFEEDLEKKIV